MHYAGEALRKWVDDETHYAAERIGFAWNEDKRCLEGLSHEQYLVTRKFVLDALVRCAMEFLQRGEPYKEFKTNLRQSLEPYLADYSYVKFLPTAKG